MEQIKTGPAGGRLRLLEQQQANRQPGQRADRAQQGNQRIKHAGEEQRTADQKPQRNARQRRQAEAHRHALQGGQHVPADAHVIGPVLIERIGKQRQRRVQRAQRRGKTFAVHRRQLPGQQQHPQPQQRGQQALNELTQPARDGWRGAPDLHRRQDNHFARRVLHADDRLLTLCLLHLMPPYVEWQNGGRSLPGQTRSRPYRPSVCCCASWLPGR